MGTFIYLKLCLNVWKLSPLFLLFLGPIPWQAADIIGGLLATELQSYRVTDTQGYPIYGWLKFFLCLLCPQGDKLFWRQFDRFGRFCSFSFGSSERKRVRNTATGKVFFSPKPDKLFSNFHAHKIYLRFRNRIGLAEPVPPQLF